MITAAQTPTQTAAQNQPAIQNNSSGLASDFETFLKMLTAQARNQDPLEPLDSSEYAAQLAQFSMVEQQVQTNELLNGLAGKLSAANLTEMAAWIGKDVRVSSVFRFQGTPVQLFAEAATGADTAVLVIRNADGQVIERLPVSPTDRKFLWAGLDDSGAPLPDGTYAATLESYRNGELQSSVTASSFSRVVEAQVENGTVLLSLDTGTEKPASEVVAVRAGS